GVLRHVRQQLREPRPSLAVLRELELRRGQCATVGTVLTVVLLDLRLVLEGVHLRHRSLHEQEDDALGPTFEVGRLRSQRVGTDGGGQGTRSVVAEQTSQGEIAEPGARCLQHLSSRGREKVWIEHGGFLDYDY